MKKSIFKLFLSMSLILFGLNLHAQQDVPASGGDATGITGSSSYSFGIVVFTTIDKANGSVAQGIQHGYDVTITSGFDNLNVNLGMTAFPNPTTDFLHVKINDLGQSKWQYQLHNIAGQLFRSNQMVDVQNTVSMTDLANATYLLTVFQDNEPVKTFKIIKN